MGKRESYEPGTFCWVDLATTDSEGAKAFYSGLFGWETDDTPAGQSGTYTMLRSRATTWVVSTRWDRNSAGRV